MPCFGPLTAYRPKGREGRLVFDKRKGETGVAMKLPCGQCHGCRLERSRQWAMRCMHEKRLWDASSFVTLTYDDVHLPSDGYLRKDDLRKFMYRIRKEFGAGIRFFACGEYGDILGRPHYHVLFFNLDFPDKRFYRNAKRGEPLFTSPALDRCWAMGHAPFGEVTFESCAYVARYCMKLITGKYADILYGDMQREFCVMSRRPGIGSGYFDRYGRSEVYVHDSVVVNGMAVRPPRFYDTRFAVDGDFSLVESREARLESIKRKRRRMASLHRSNQTSRRLRVREVVSLAKLKLKGRVL